MMEDEEIFEPEDVFGGNKSAMRRVQQALLACLPKEGSYKISEVVDETIAWLATYDPNSLAEFYATHGKYMLHEFLRRRQASERQRFRNAIAGKAFTRAAEIYQETGDASVLKPFQMVYTTDTTNTRKRVADMTGKDHDYVASQLENNVRRQKLVATFHRQVAEMVGDQRTADVIDEETYAKLYKSLVS
jgi:hypothetical protein